ncbi:hypothetical protein [Noviherbaspirillum galbum]|uniref:Uncharacterized protein n=1 Tax=Noviherbaspirillum galbum TaxID=2709383 RepID=A0A6B3SR38_9BURK|nr:hypothetical protein [Noviherbaspirillum galbum]NEX63223.1 hypothetical protein [Noviherbaspirillum galbum]
MKTPRSTTGHMKSAHKEHHIKTSQHNNASPTPLEPHERDERDELPEEQPRDDIKQAYKDLQAGMVDTDLRETGGVDEVVNDRPGKSPDKVIKKNW